MQQYREMRGQGSCVFCDLSQNNTATLKPAKRPNTVMKEGTGENVIQPGFTTPTNTRRKLVFGVNLTPEQGQA